MAMSIIKTHKTKGEIITARCGVHVKEILHRVSELEKVSMSDVITKSVVEYHRRHYSDILKAEKELFGRRSSGRGDLSTKRKQYLREMLGGKHSHN